MSTEKLPDSWIRANWPAPANIVAFTTSRSSIADKISDTKLSGYQAFNLANHVNDNEESVMRNREQLSTLCSLAPTDFRWLDQIHSNTLVNAENAKFSIKADASYTRKKQEACTIMTADCLPVLFCNKQATQVAAAHAGWRGLASGILKNTVQSFENPKDIIAWLGPAISQKAFEVGDDVLQSFCTNNSQARQAFKPATTNGKWYADLYELARLELNTLGITEVYGGEYCTYNDAELFYSYRRDGAQSGRMASVVYIR